MKVAILVPRRAGVAERDRLWDFARGWWENDHPDWPIVEGHHDVGPFNRAAAINDAARKAGDWDVAVIIDADVLTDPHVVRAAVDVAAGTNAMVLSHDERIMLSRKGTEKVLGGFRGNWRTSGMFDRVYTDGCSCCVAVSRELWDEVGGFDEGFQGWGYEDIAFRISCETLSQKPMIKLSSPLWHLWHTTSHENNPRSETYLRNVARNAEYQAANGDPDAIRALHVDAPVAVLRDSRIPRILIRTVPANTADQVEHWWTHFQQLHPGWEFKTYREPISPDDFPITSDLWDRCQNGAQKAGLIRLEALWRHGGVYVDSDCEPFRSLEPLMQLEGFAGWEDSSVIPDAVIGAVAEHPAIKECLGQARAIIMAGGDAWSSGPGVTTEVLRSRNDVLVLPPGAFYPHHYLERNAKAEQRSREQPWPFLAHRWEGSWLSAAQRQSIASRQT